MKCNKVEEVALQNGMISLPDTSGTNIDVQILIQPRLVTTRFLMPDGKQTGAYRYGLCFGRPTRLLTSC
jgi:hypothetical protein